jgi:hypothetical protein
MRRSRPTSVSLTGRRGKRDVGEAEARLKHLDPFFQQARVVSITADRITRYVQARQQEGAANGTINRELATLSRMLRLAYRNGKLLRLPVIERLAEADPREGFFEGEQYLAVRRHLPADRRAEPRARQRRPVRGHEDHRPPNRERVSALRDRQRGLTFRRPSRNSRAQFRAHRSRQW